MSARRATSLRPGQFKHLIWVAFAIGRMPERDVMLLLLTHTTGIRVTKLVLLEVADVLYSSGAIKPEVYFRADITKGCRPRNVYMPHAPCPMPDALPRLMRARRRRRLSGADEYRGFRPGLKLVTTHKGRAFELAFKHRQLDSGLEVCRACDSLQQTISRLYRQAGIKQMSWPLTVMPYGASQTTRRLWAQPIIISGSGISRTTQPPQCSSRLQKMAPRCDAWATERAV